MTKEHLKSNAAAMIAFANREPIEWKHLGSGKPDGWNELKGSPSWDFGDILYRPKPATKTRAWSKPDDVPGPVCWIRRTGTVNCGMIIRIGEMTIAGIGADAVVALKWGELEDYEYSTDRKTWHHCEVTE